MIMKRELKSCQVDALALFEVPTALENLYYAAKDSKEKSCFISSVQSPEHEKTRFNIFDFT